MTNLEKTKGKTVRTLPDIYAELKSITICYKKSTLTLYTCICTYQMVGILPDRSATYLQQCSLRSVDGCWDILDFYPDTLMIMAAVYIFILIRCFNYPRVVIAL